MPSSMPYPGLAHTGELGLGGPSKRQRGHGARLSMGLARIAAA